MTTHLASFVVGGAPEPWAALGFTVVGGLIPLANGAIELDADADGPIAIRVDRERGDPAPAHDLDGVVLLDGRPPPAVGHPNGCVELDHLVIVTPSLERTSGAIERVLGLPRRRLRETASVRQAFHRFDDRGCIVELVERADAAGAAPWGLVATTTDLDGLVAAAGGLVGAPKPAVQPGRRIATVRRDAGLGCAVAFMTP